MSTPKKMVFSGEQNLDMDRLSYEIFSILESKFLFGCDDPKLLLQPTAVAPACPGKIRVLSVDAGGATDGLLAAASLVRLESSLRKLTGDPTALISDFFDVAAGSGAGGVLVAVLFTRIAGDRPLFSAAEAFDFLIRSRRVLQPLRRKKRGLSRIFQKKSAAEPRDQILRRVFGSATLRDTVKPVLVPCYDLVTGAPFLFSRADAVESDDYDFFMRDVCAATVGGGRTRSLNGRTTVAAADGGAVAGNPAAAAVTHVLNNKLEFPFAAGVEDLLVMSLGNGESAAASGDGRRRPAPLDIVKIAGEGASDMVDQAVAMAFGDQRTTNYVRIQAKLCGAGEFQSPSNAGELLAMAEDLLAQKNVESVLLWGKRVSGRTNAEKLEWASAELVKEDDRRKRCPLPLVVSKQGSPRSASRSPASSSSSSPLAAASPR